VLNVFVFLSSFEPRMNIHWWTWASYVTVFVILAVGHFVWFDITHDPTIGMRFGTAVIALGIVVTARPYFRIGLRETVDRQMPGRQLSSQASVAHLHRQTKAHKIARPGIVHDVVAERVIGVALVLFGTLVNGYGDMPLRWMRHAVE
jgi:hypothetical protein